MNNNNSNTNKHKNSNKNKDKNKHNNSNKNKHKNKKKKRNLLTEEDKKKYEKTKEKLEDDSWCYLMNTKDEDKIFLPPELCNEFVQINEVSINNLIWDGKHKIRKLNIICSEESVKLKNVLNYSRDIVKILLNDNKKVCVWRQNCLQSSILNYNIKIKKNSKVLIDNLLKNLTKIIKTGKKKNILLIIDKDNVKESGYKVLTKEGKLDSFHSKEISKELIENYTKNKN